MSIRKHIEHADDALRLAIIEALEKKQDEQLQTLFEALSKVKELILTTPIRGVDNVASYYRNKAEYDFKLDSPHLDDTIINFPTGNAAADTISFSDDVGYTLGQDVITFGDETSTKHGKDLDKLDGPS
tara:strand:- start:25 stop:408 length:384 start_codon:yes stop_codon:yes gene_type:complete